MKFNMDIKTRDEIIFGEYNADAYLGGVRKFDGMDVETLQKLVDMGFADPDDCQNYSPSIADFIDFMEYTEGYVVGGYVVTDKRDDYRVSVDKIESKKQITTYENLVEFVGFARYADEFDVDGFAWWD